MSMVQRMQQAVKAMDPAKTTTATAAAMGAAAPSRWSAHVVSARTTATTPRTWSSTGPRKAPWSWPSAWPRQAPWPSPTARSRETARTASLTSQAGLAVVVTKNR